MFKCKIEKGVPLPARSGKAGSIFNTKLIEYLDKLEVGDSILFKLSDSGGYNFTVKVNNVLRIYRIIKKQDFTSEWGEDSRTFRIWRTE